MKKIVLFFLFILVVCLGGCASDGGLMNLSSLPVNGEDIVQITGDIKDSSVQKEAIYFKARADRDRQYAKLYALEGFSMEMMLQEVKPGIYVQVIKKVTHRSAPRFNQHLPSGPSKHPVWAAVDKTIDAAKVLTLGWFAYDVTKTGWENTAPTYNGPYQSNNPITTTTSTTSGISP